MAPDRKAKRAARRLFRVCLVGGVLDEDRARRVGERLVHSGRRGSRQALWEFLRLVRLDLDRRTAVVETAAALTPDVREAVGAALTGTYGGALKTSFAVNPTLIGGMRVKVGSDVFDGSVRARLAALEARF